MAPKGLECRRIDLPMEVLRQISFGTEAQLTQNQARLMRIFFCEPLSLPGSRRRNSQQLGPISFAAKPGPAR